ncbi:MAG TPA: HlyD family secretion protein [Acidocella sp.]|jgi:RND family efflux transporter MFP subunit|uniref:HlyD family secretion protein n=1 Tax=Acidocella sp. TaxID=50710 RepID=UPI002B5EEB64|nr:HlyD family secretion protein [Acidocella sp.]HVE23235.1 HlyD family secretion protein [Acidocella sp.]
MKAASLSLRLLVTALLVAVAAVVAWQLWVYYMDDPWTRDGAVRADTVQLAPDVSGPVTRVFVHDNELVKTGEPLFQVDPTRFLLAILQAEADVTRTKAVMQDAQRTASRYGSLSANAVSSEDRDHVVSAAQESQAAYQLAQANLALANYNLQRATVRATVNGTITNFSMRPGDFVTSGTPVLALVDADSLYVDGYFEETKLRQIHVGDAARVMLMDGSPAILGHVQGFAAGITDGQRTASPTLLANVNPTFTWVRLAQRVPVRIALDHVPAGTKLVAGMTCTVVIGQKEAGAF